MSTPIKPRQLTKATSGAAAPLTKAEQAMLLSFRTMDDTGREHIAIIAKTIAENHPCRPRPLLQLIKGGAT